MKLMTTGLAQSVHTRLVRHAKELGVDPNVVLARYATERFLYCLSRSRHADRFILKGAMLILVWLGETIRPTRDADLLGFGDLSEEALAATFREILALDVEPDGLTFDLSSLRIAAIRAEDPYGGQRATFVGYLGATRLNVRVDVGIGDAVEPEPEMLEYPSLLDLPRPRLRAYRPETAIAEKLHAMVTLGAANSRMRDFFDIHALATRKPFDGAVLARAFRATFERRGTPIPAETPLALTQAFAAIEGKEAQWAAYIRKNAIKSAPESLGLIIPELEAFFAPVLAAIRSGAPFAGSWPPGGPWR
ncbi:MAG: nucleotidyl transferase AbiEii/AbiGii toxin family protein [Thermoanaerobaculia bacterium]